MTNRLYANNFRSLVAFEASFDSYSVLCGPNGSGKSSVMDALGIILDLASASVPIERAVRFDDQTKWTDANVIEFEIDIHSEGNDFTYRISIEQVSEAYNPRIVAESATCNNKSLFERSLTGVKLSTMRGTFAEFPLDWRQAALGAIDSARNKEVRILQQALKAILIARPIPMDMEIESKSEQERPNVGLRDLISWYRHLYQNQEWADHFRNALHEVWPDFRAFNLVGTGVQAKALQLRFDSSGSAESSSLFTGQLSAGERMLLALYMIQSALATGAISTVLIDEPDNFVGLPELQPWILTLMEVIGGGA